ncbi:MAG: ATP-binding cassette domain-containing protein [SAR324 cluster bacterium]|nr:ATP-binding cassette domain-containing protein [SAR324 cluster bacterium]
MIRVDKLTKDFGTARVVDQISFEVKKGEVLGFLGPNGAGKSTTMKMLTCFLPPTSGTADICGFNIRKHPIEVRKNIGYLPESAPSYQEMLVEEFLLFAGEIRGLTGKMLKNSVEKVLELAALKDVRYQMIETLSKGYRQRTCLAQSLIHEPPVLILDEPTDGLDPNQKHEVRTLIKHLSEQRAVLVSTHILEEVETICTRALIIARGKLVADGTPEQLMSRSRFHNAVSLTIETSAPDQVSGALKQLAQVDSVQITRVENNHLSVQLFPKAGQTLHKQVDQFLREKNMNVLELFVEKGHLDEVFRQVTTV